MRLDCYAKVNIGLSVGEVRSDGYHGIRTNMALISLSDTIEVDFRESDRTSVAIEGNTGYLEAGRTDLMEKINQLGNHEQKKCVVRYLNTALEGKLFENTRVYLDDFPRFVLYQEGVKETIDVLLHGSEYKVSKVTPV